MRNFLYWLAKFMGDVNAVKRGKAKRRVRNRIVGKITGRFFK